MILGKETEEFISEISYLNKQSEILISHIKEVEPTIKRLDISIAKYEDKIDRKIKNVLKEDLQRITERYFNEISIRTEQTSKRSEELVNKTLLNLEEQSAKKGNINFIYITLTAVVFFILGYLVKLS